MPVVVTIRRGEDLENDDSLLKKIPHEIMVYRTRTVDFWRMWRQGKYQALTQKTERESSNNKQHEPSRNGAQKFSWLAWLKTFVSELITTPDHMVFWVPFAVAKGSSLLIENEVHVIYTSSPPHSEHMAGLFLSKLFHKPWVADFRDPMLDSSGYNPTTKFRRWIDRVLENKVVRHADKVLIISDHYKKKMEERYPSFAHKFITLPNAYDPGDFEDVQPEVFDKCTIIYAGSFYAERSPRFFLRGFGAWYRDQPLKIQENVQVIFYGMMPAEVMQYIRQEGLENVVLSPGIIRKDKLIPKLLGADILLLIIGFDIESRGTVTSKIFEYMACKRPILAMVPEGDAADILKQYEQTYLITSENIKLLREYLNQAYSNYIQSKNKKQNAKAMDEMIGTGCDMYNARYQTKRLADCFNTIIVPGKKSSI